MTDEELRDLLTVDIWSAGFTVRYVDTLTKDGRALDGKMDPTRKVVSIRKGLPLGEEVHVLAHELAHIRDWPNGSWKCLRGDDGADRAADQIIKEMSYARPV